MRLAIAQKQAPDECVFRRYPTREERARLAEQVDTLAKGIDEQLAYISDLAVKTTKEYNEYTTKDYLRFSIPEFSLPDIINLSNIKRA